MCCLWSAHCHVQVLAVMAELHERHSDAHSARIRLDVRRCHCCYFSFALTPSQKWFLSLVSRVFPAVYLPALRVGYVLAEDLLSDRLDLLDIRRHAAAAAKPRKKPGRKVSMHQ